VLPSGECTVVRFGGIKGIGRIQKIGSEREFSSPADCEPWHAELNYILTDLTTPPHLATCSPALLQHGLSCTSHRWLSILRYAPTNFSGPPPSMVSRAKTNASTHAVRGTQHPAGALLQRTGASYPMPSHSVISEATRPVNGGYNCLRPGKRIGGPHQRP